MTVKEAILRSLQERKALSTHMEIYNHIIENGYYDFGDGKTPARTVSAQVGEFIRKGDTRVKRIKNKKGAFSYYLTAVEDELDLEQAQAIPIEQKKASQPKQGYRERDLHILLSSYLNNQKV